MNKIITAEDLPKIQKEPQVFSRQNWSRYYEFFIHFSAEDKLANRKFMAMLQRLAKRQENDGSKFIDSTGPRQKNHTWKRWTFNDASLFRISRHFYREVKELEISVRFDGPERYAIASWDMHIKMVFSGPTTEEVEEAAADFLKSPLALITSIHRELLESDERNRKWFEENVRVINVEPDENGHATISVNDLFGA